MNNRKNYPPDWFDTIRPAILAREQYRCKFCKRKQRTQYVIDAMGQWLEADAFMLSYAANNGLKVKTIYLQIAHLDQNPSNNDYANLAALCTGCHLNYDRPFNDLKRKSRKSV